MNKQNTRMSTCYYLNEYSLRGQFECIDDFFDSMQKFTLPLLKKIYEVDGALLLKKTDFWQLKICHDYTLDDLKKISNKRYPQITALKVCIQRILCEEPYWDIESAPKIEVVSYNFDEEYCNNFVEDNCFLRALEHGDNIVSFWHDAYRRDKLSICVIRDERVMDESLHNLACNEHWPKEEIDKKWMVAEGIYAYIRLKEPDNHKPHFHVECENYTGSFDLITGMVLKQNGNTNLSKEVCVIVKKWHKDNVLQLRNAWCKYHGNF